MANTENTQPIPAESQEDFDWSSIEDEYRAEMDADYWSGTPESYHWDDDPNPYHGDYSEM